jgi:hypothetical protein
MAVAPLYLPTPAMDWTDTQPVVQAESPVAPSPPLFLSLAPPRPFRLASCPWLLLCRAPPLQRGHRQPPLAASLHAALLTSGQVSSPDSSLARAYTANGRRLLDEMLRATPSRGPAPSCEAHAIPGGRAYRGGYPPNELALQVSAPSPCLSFSFWALSPNPPLNQAPDRAEGKDL